MNHDPLCSWSPANNETELDFCDCDLIARVREDERLSSCAEDLHTDCPCYQEGHTHGYAAALRDAVEVVKAIKAWDYGVAVKNRAVAAIEALVSTPDVTESDKEKHPHG